MRGVTQHGRNDSGGTVGRGRDDAPARGVLLVDRQRHQIDPVEGEFGLTIGVFGTQALVPTLGPTAYLQAAGKQTVARDALAFALDHDVTQVKEAAADIFLGPAT